jgi:hypothetical protein
MKNKYILISFDFVNNFSKYKFKKVGVYTSFDNAIEGMIKDIAKSYKCPVEEWLEGGTDAIDMEKGEYMCFLPTKSLELKKKYWKIFEI